MKSSALERFLRYVTIDTRSDEHSSTVPSTPGQLVLLRQLAAELQSLGLADAVLDDYGYVMATIPATASLAHLPAIGFIAHVDTSPEMPGDGVKPIVHEQYDGGDLVLPDDPSVVLRAKENPALAQQIGHDIVTASGLTLLGADDKAGVAEIVAAAEYLIAHPEIPHGPVRLAFTPDEEIGRGADHFDVRRFGAVCAYTLDGGGRGELELESFSADAVTVTFKGFNTHPGYAKGRMVNAIRLAADFIARLPRDEMSPETTEGYQGYLHPYQVHASVDRTSVKVLVRDFVTAALKEKEAVVERLAREVAAAHSGRVGRARGRGILPEHAGGARAPPARRGLRARSHSPRRHGADRAPDPRRHRRLAPVVHGTADAEPVCRGAQLPFAARVGVGAGHG